MASFIWDGDDCVRIRRNGDEEVVGCITYGNGNDLIANTLNNGIPKPLSKHARYSLAQNEVEAHHA